MLGAATSKKNRVQKILEDANVKLGSVLSDVFGVSGQLMLEALLEGKAQPEEVAALAQRKAKKEDPGFDCRPAGTPDEFAHHRRMIGYSLEHLRFLEEQLAQLDRDISDQIEAAGLNRQWEQLRSLAGIEQTSAATILAETGADMAQFPSEKHLSSWSGVCPGNNESAGKRKSARTTGGNPWLRSVLAECAWARGQQERLFSEGQVWAHKDHARRQETAGHHGRGTRAADPDL